VTTTPERREQIGEFFAANVTRLHNTVRAAARGPEPVIEDACQAAWTILLRRPDVTLDARGLSWLATVAIREAWRQASTARETPAGGVSGHHERPRRRAARARAPRRAARARADRAQRARRGARDAQAARARGALPARPRPPLPRDRQVIWSHPVSSPPATRCGALTTCRRGGRRLGYRPWAARQGLEAVAGVPASSTMCADARLGDANESSALSGTRL
jgi:hypothetical protein